MKPIHLKDHVLMLHSAVIEREEYRWLNELLTSHDEITAELVEGLDTDKQNFMENVLPLLKKQALDEWELASNTIRIQDLGEVKEKCSICHTNLRYVCHIRNKFNYNELKIGTTCAEHFGFNGNKSADELIKEAKELRLITLMNEKFPGIYNIIQSWKKDLENFSVIIPTCLEKPYLELYNKTKKLYDDYIKGEKDQEECFKQIRELLNKKKKKLEEIVAYDESNKDNIYIPTMRAKQWLKERNKFDIIEELKNSGNYTISNIRKVKEPNFMNSIVSELNKKIFKEIKAKIRSAIEEEFSYIYFFENLSNLELKIRHEVLLLEYGYQLLGQESVRDLNRYNILKLSKISNESFDPAINILNRLFSRIAYSVYYYDIEFDDIFIKLGNNYYQYGLSSLLESYKYNIFGLENESTIDKYFDEFRVKALNKEEIDERISNR